MSNGVGGNRSIVVCACVFIFGLALLAAVHLPILNPGQCPLGYSQEQVDRSNCIIGAKHRRRSALEIGVLLAVVGGLTLFVCVAARLVEKYMA